MVEGAFFFLMTTPLLCETVTGRSMAELLAGRDAATTGDMVELRLDGLRDLDVAGALHGRRVPVVVTCRPAWEGGLFSGTEEERCAILSRAFELGAEFVDVEWRACQGGSGGSAHTGVGELVRCNPARAVVSSHDFAGVPADLEDRVLAMRATGAGTVKVAVTAGRLTDTLRLKNIARGGPTVAVGMGDVGVPTRLLAGRYGSRWTYAGDAVAPGQIPARRMVEDYGFRRVGDSTQIFGVVSTRALSSLSPVMHNAAFAAAGVDAAYVPLTVHEFDDFITFADEMGIDGVSVTIPFKLDALRVAASRDDVSQRVGAANTLRRRGHGWDASNTDVEGFLAPLGTVLPGPMKGLRAAVLGGGGSARAVVAGLTALGVTVTVHARRTEQSREIARTFGVDAGRFPPEPGSWDLLVNCTPLGSAGRRHESPMPVAALDGRLVYDLTYGPGESALVRDARSAGCATLDGLPMLVAQAERQFEWWTGRAPVPGVMEAAARRSNQCG